MSSDPNSKVKLALFGIGRMGQVRLRALANTPRLQLVAATDTKPGSDELAKEILPPGAKFFNDPEDCFLKSGAQAVLISTATATHAPLILRALELGLHVMCEKPIAVGLDITRQVVDFARTKPELKFLVPFNRRFDDSYRSAKALVESGALGEIHAVETAVLDQQDPTGFFVTFSEQSGGIFLDMGVHDIDIGRAFLEPTKGIKNSKKQVNKVFAVGQQAVYPALKKYGDADNGWGLVEFANGKILTIHVGRTLKNGFEGPTRIYGTNGYAIVGGNANSDRVEVRDSFGVRTSTTPDAFALWNLALQNDLNEFALAILDNKELPLKPEDALEAGKIGTALQHSFRTGLPVFFDDEGEPIFPVPDNTTINGHVIL
ncbi:NAD(P)-binding protein [Meredithblackwellia eburnea MCA 4105]